MASGSACSEPVCPPLDKARGARNPQFPAQVAPSLLAKPTYTAFAGPMLPRGCWDVDVHMLRFQGARGCCWQGCVGWLSAHMCVRPLVMQDSVCGEGAGREGGSGTDRGGGWCPGLLTPLYQSGALRRLRLETRAALPGVMKAYLPRWGIQLIHLLSIGIYSRPLI